MKITKRATSILLLLLLHFVAYSQNNVLTDTLMEQKLEKVEISFDLDSHIVDPDFGCNSEKLQSLSAFIDRFENDSLITLSKILINSYTSPEGGRIYNQKLSQKRTRAIYDYVRQIVPVPDSLISSESSGTDWKGLRSLVEQSDMLYRDEVLSIIDDVPEETWRKVKPNDRWMTLVDSRLKHLKEFNYGRTYRYMAEHFYPSLRSSSIVTIYYQTTSSPVVVEDTVVMPSVVEPETIDSIKKVDTIKNVEVAPALVGSVAEYPTQLIGARDGCSLRFAVKTNLLYDALLIPSIELEIPIGERWSVAGEWIFPWWVTKDNGNALEILSGQIEGRYWFGNRINKPQLTGWYAGFYAGGGLYDLQWKNNGYQGEFYIAAGLSGGYAHTINKSGSLRMEYSLGLGYLSTKYRYYEGKQNNEYLVWQHDGKYSWLGPTKLKVSLVWFINWQIGGGR